MDLYVGKYLYMQKLYERNCMLGWSQAFLFCGVKILIRVIHDAF